MKKDGPTRVYIAGAKRGKPLNMFAYAAFVASNRMRDLRAPHNSSYAEDLVSHFHSFWTLTSDISSAELVVYAHQYEDCVEVHKLAAQMQERDKPLLFLGASESEPRSSIAYGSIYKASVFASTRPKNELPSPAFHADVLCERGLNRVQPLEKADRPTMGFCGFVGSRLQRFAYAASGLRGMRQKAEGLRIRSKVLDAFESKSDVDCSFVRRHKYLGNATLASFEKPGLLGHRQVYLNNLFGSLYGLAVRGKGNHSVRFYEILCAGRIPVFVNTDCELPFQDAIDYRKHVILIEIGQIEKAGSIVCAFHDAASELTLQRMQVENRRLWEEWFSPLGFFKKVVRV